MSNAEPFYALGEIPAGSDAAKGFFFFGVDAGRELVVSAIPYWGGDSGENYALVIVPASQSVHDVAIDGGAGMFYLAQPAKGGQTSSYQGLWTGNGAQRPLHIPGPCSVVMASTNAANTAAFYSGVYGVMRDL